MTDMTPETPTPLTAAELAAQVTALEIADPTRAALRQQLVALGVTKIEIEYNGGGDEGNTEAPVIHPTDASIELGFDLENAVDGFLWRMICNRHGGFENNEGGFGTLTWDLQTGSISLDHHDYITETERTYDEAI